MVVKDAVDMAAAGGNRASKIVDSRDAYAAYEDGMVEPTTPRTFEEWLALADEQRDAVHKSWNVYDREGIGFAYTAGGRLAIASDTYVFDIQVGTYHGGVYVLHAYVADAAMQNLPKMLEQRFEGFHVIWLPVSKCR